jgi:hypothetical protein
LDKDDCFAIPDHSQVHEPYKVLLFSYLFALVLLSSPRLFCSTKIVISMLN